jgi:hypothetical protein
MFLTGLMIDDGKTNRSSGKDSQRSGRTTITATAFCFPAPASIRAGNKTRLNISHQQQPA